MTQFVNVKGVRIRLSTIKRYTPFGETKLSIYYTSSRSKIEVEHFDFDSASQRDSMLETLDNLL